MSETPKKIYKSRNYERDFLGLFGFWADRDSGNCTEYIRSDLVDGMREALEAMIAVRPLGKHINPPCDCELCKATRLGKAALEAGKVDE